MKTWGAVTLFIWLVACATTHPRNADPVARLIYSGAKNDLIPGLYTPQAGTEVSETAGEPNITTFPLTYAVACNGTKTDCRHAVIRTSLTARYTLDGANRLRVEGTLRSEMARSLTTSGRAGSETLSVDDSVPVIGTVTTDTAVDLNLGVGEKWTLTGLVGEAVTVVHE